MVEPPADLKTIVDKTAAFVARNGPEFETRIRNEQNNVKFSFLQPNDPYNAYYRAKVVELGGTTPAAEGAASTAVVPSASSEVSAATTAKPAPKKASITPVEPPKPQYSVLKPPGVNPLDLDVIQLTAQFVACNGRSFLTGVANRESKNPQFDFLKPTHHLFHHFTALVDSYSKCLMPPDDVASGHAKDGADSLRTLTRVQQYAAFTRERDREKLSKEQAIEEERRAQLLVDWHDFVVVETIGFEDEDETLPAPQELEVATGGAETAEPAAGKPGSTQPPAAPSEPPAESEPMETETSVRSRVDEASEALAASKLKPVPEHLIRRDYTPQIGVKTSGGTGAYAVDPLTGQQVRIDEMEEHMRISLLDPKWKEQKQIEEERRKDSNIAEGDDIGRNLKSFAARRTDIFGDKEVGIGEVVGKPAGQESKEAAGRVIWDGHSSRSPRRPIRLCRRDWPGAKRSLRAR